MKHLIFAPGDDQRNAAIVRRSPVVSLWKMGKERVVRGESDAKTLEKERKIYEREIGYTRLLENLAAWPRGCLYLLLTDARITGSVMRDAKSSGGWQRVEVLVSLSQLLEVIIRQEAAIIIITTSTPAEVAREAAKSACRFFLPILRYREGEEYVWLDAAQLVAT